MTNTESRRTLLAISAVIIVLILIISSIFVYNLYYKQDEKENKEPKQKVIDDRISPLENQGMILEVLRIRQRGLYDILTSAINSWKIFSKPWENKPSFYFVAELDNLEYESKNVGQLAWMDEILFTGWDTMFQENKLSRDAEEEQETSTIKLSIVERVPVKIGLFRKGTEDIVKETIEITYDYRTGRWTGDDNFMDYDGYGHYIGNTFEVWFNIYQNDADVDYIPYWVEVNILGTDPTVDDSQQDPDGDGISTSWEWRWGYDPNVWNDHRHLDPDLDGLENIEEYETSRWLSDPYHQDIYCEIDYMAANSRLDPDHHFWEEGQQMITELFCRNNINVYFDQGWPDTPAQNGGGEVLPHYISFSQDSGMILQFYNHNFPDERKGIFRYVVMSHGGGFNHPAKGNIYDCIDIGWSLWDPGQLMDSIKGYVIHMFVHKLPPVPASKKFTSTITLMHEIGHSIGLHPWTFEGNDNYSCFSTDKAEKNRYYDTWGNYKSIMNYGIMYNFNNHKFDFSDGSNGAPYDQEDWKQIFVADFQYNSVQVEEIYFEPPRFEAIVWGETEHGVTGYSFDEDLTAQWEKTIGDWSPVDPVPVNWAVFKLVDKEKYPNYSEIKIFAEPDTNKYVHWCEYAEGNLDSSGNILIYNQQEITKNIFEQIE